MVVTREKLVEKSQLVRARLHERAQPSRRLGAEQSLVPLRRVDQEQADALTAGAPKRADSVRVQHLVRPGTAPGDNGYHYLVIHLDGSRMWVEVIGVDWGRGFAPYRSNRATLSDTASTP
ncbi:MAG: hypothetical protein WD825_10165 [Gemmatimonadaceae bacterium]